MSRKKSYMNVSSILTENFITDFFKKMFGNSNEKKVYKRFEDDPKIAKKIKQTADLMKKHRANMKSAGYEWKPKQGGWVKKKK